MKEKCRKCGKEFVRLLTHLSQKEACNQAYGSAELDELKAENRKRSFKAYNARNKEVINQKQRRYDEEHKAERQARDWKKKDKMTAADRILSFKQDIIEGPNFVCQSCNRCLFKKSVKILNDNQEETLIGKTGIHFYQTIISHNNTITCPYFFTLASIH